MKKKVIKRIRVDLSPYLTELLESTSKTQQLGTCWLFEVMVSATLEQLCDPMSDYNLGGQHQLHGVLMEVEDTLCYEHMIMKHHYGQPISLTETESVIRYFDPVVKLLQRLIDNEDNRFSKQYRLSGVTNGIFHVTVSR